MVLLSVLKSIFLWVIYVGSAVIFLIAFSEHWVLSLLWGRCLWSWQWIRQLNALAAKETEDSSGQHFQPSLQVENAVQPQINLLDNPDSTEWYWHILELVSRVDYSRNFSIEVPWQPTKICAGVMDWTFAFSQNAYAGDLSPSVTILGGRAYGRSLVMRVKAS